MTEEEHDNRESNSPSPEIPTTEADQDLTPESIGKDMPSSAQSAQPSSTQVQASGPIQQPSTATPAEAQKNAQNSAVKIGIIAVIVLALLGGGFGVFKYMESEREKREAEEARIAAIEAHNEYVDNLAAIQLEILNGAAITEEAVNLMLDVWHSAIFYDDVSEWSADTAPYFSTDFNTSLALLFASSTWHDYETQISESQETVDSLMRKLNNPPDDCERAYETLQTLYSQYNTFVGLALNPSGSYQSLSSTFGDLDSEVLSSYQLLGTQIPEKIPVE